MGITYEHMFCMFSVAFVNEIKVPESGYLIMNPIVKIMWGKATAALQWT